MQHDRRMAAAATSMAPGSEAMNKDRPRVQPGPITRIPRRLDPLVALALEEVPVSALPHLRLVGRPAAIPGGVAAAVAVLNGHAPGLGDWLVDDIDFLARIYRESTGAETVKLRLEPVTDDACRRFHADNVRFRLITTYRGPGTEWIAPADTATVVDGRPTRPEKIRHLDRGEIAILRGRKAAGTGEPPLLHRSPPLGDSGAVRLFLAIDDGADDALSKRPPPPRAAH